MVNFEEKMEKSFIIPKILLQITGLLPDQNGNLNKLSVIFFILLSAIMLLISIIECLYVWPNVTIILFTITLSLAQVHSYLKFREYLLSQKKIAVLLRTIRSEFWFEVKDACEEEQQLIEDYGQQAYRFNFLQTSLLVISGAIVTIKQIKWAVDVVLFHLNVIESAPENILTTRDDDGSLNGTQNDMYYEVLIAVQSLGHVYLVLIFSAIDTLFVYIVFSSSAQLKLIQYRIRQFYEEELKGNNNYLHKSIVHHQKLCQFCKEIDVCFKRPIFIQNFMCILYLSIVMYISLLLIEEHLDFVIYLAFGGGAATAQLFSYFYAADLMTTEGIAIAQASYDSDWVDATTSTKKSICIIIMRAQRPLYLTVGGVSKASLSTFQTVMRTTFSYFTVMKSVMDDKY